MVENALCGAAACLGLGRSVAEITDGLRTFRNDAEHNLGRLNLFEVREVKVVIDYAHNEAGLRHLLTLARDLAQPAGHVLAIIGTAGDRTDEALQGIGRLAGASSDQVFIKETAKYLRGRQTNAEMNVHYVAGINEAGCRQWSIQPSELDAIRAALDAAAAGDVIAMMCLEQIPDVERLLLERGHAVD
jgi:cyanophycin synthetase